MNNKNGRTNLFLNNGKYEYTTITTQIFKIAVYLPIGIRIYMYTYALKNVCVIRYDLVTTYKHYSILLHTSCPLIKGTQFVKHESDWTKGREYMLQARVFRRILQNPPDLETWLKITVHALFKS